MAHVIEPALTGRSKCRGCGAAIGQGTLRFGERIANVFGEREATLWFHLQCAAYKRPEALLTVLPDGRLTEAERARLRADTERSVAHRRLPRIAGADVASGARARCRHCRDTIAKGEWRIALAIFAEGAFHARGFVHVRCARAYFEAPDEVVIERVCRFAAGLGERDIEALRRAFAP
ncbi:MAG TPA: hypothetical protein VFG38_09695 [Pseudomonadales bacterium]|nr:hypothetical protein [Pseudomonadales bacterium]